ncbi:MAG: hypothetical protein SFX73_24830 [Kofleriaceae bacterium]|nr:hypothetical protein [Kofleriaceae bacterium]
MRIALSSIIALVVGLVSTRIAAADPVLGRVLTAPTAWLPPEGAVVASGGTLHRVGQVVGFGFLDAGVGLGGIASVNLATDTDVRGCVDACARPEELLLGRASFRLGARQNAWFPGMPALLVGVRTTYAARGHDFGRARVSDAYLVASRVLGSVRLHAGVGATAAGFGDEPVTLGPTLRPFGGVEWTPPTYPRTSVLADIAYLPMFRPDRIDLEWMAGWGVRYQALRWGSIELAVRHREAEGLEDSTVMIRLNGLFAGGKTRM